MRSLVLLLLVGCSRASQVDVVVPPASVTATVTTPPPPVASTAPAPVARDLILVQGELVELPTLARHLLTKENVWAGAVQGDTAYVWAERHQIQAFDTSTYALRWSKALVSCWTMIATPKGAMCSSEAGVRFFRKSDGDTKIVGAPSGVNALVQLGGRTLALHGTNLEALDDEGRVLSSTTVPVTPDAAYTKSSLAVSGSLACGSQRSDAASSTFCVDATPRVVWKKSVPVGGGYITQVSDVIVIASDTWSKAPSSEVLRTSDGTTLLHLPGVRLAAALSTSGALDGALTAEPAVMMFDAHGSVKWTWTGTPFHQEAMHVVRSGTNLVMAIHSPIATGTQLFALDAASGTLAWTGNVDSLPIAHSKYRNEVELEDRKGTLLLRGWESSQEYAQTFDPATGKRTATVLVGR